MTGQQHLIQCHCVLPQYRGRKDPVYHKFTVFSIIDESDTVVPKFVQCNNCGVIHKVYDICKSEIITGKDEMRNTAKIDDFKFFDKVTRVDFNNKEIREVKRAARCIVNLCEIREDIDFRENAINSLVNGLHWTHIH